MLHTPNKAFGLMFITNQLALKTVLVLRSRAVDTFAPIYHT